MRRAGAKVPRCLADALADCEESFLLVAFDLIP